MLPLLLFDSHFLEVIEGAVVDVEIDISLDAGKAACIGVLPELPFAFVVEGVHVVVGYPIGIVVEDGGAEILLFEFIIGVDDGLHVITVFDDVKPGEHIALEVLYGTLLRLVLDVEDGRQVTLFESHFLEEIVGLFAG